MNPIIPMVVNAGISLIAVLIAYATLRRLIENDKKDHEKLLKTELSTSLELFKKELGSRIIAVDDKRREDVQALHARIYELENRTFSSINERLGKVEAEMSGVQSELRGNTNILRIIQEKYIQEGGS